MKHISVIDFAKIKNDKNIILLDVRTIEEINYAHLNGIHIPLDELEQRYTELDLDKTIYCLCHHGIRSQHAAAFLDHIGAQHTVNIEGGIDAYAKLVDTSVGIY